MDMKKEKVIVRFPTGTIVNGLWAALEESIQQKCPVEFDWNGVPILVDPQAYLDSLYKKWEKDRGAKS